MTASHQALGITGPIVPGAGWRIDHVVPGSPAADAGLAAGDVIVGIFNFPAWHAPLALALVAGMDLGDCIPLLVERARAQEGMLLAHRQAGRSRRRCVLRVETSGVDWLPHEISAARLADHRIAEPTPV